MSRPDRIFKNAVNKALDRVLSGLPFDNKSELARELAVSRTTVRAILAHLEASRILDAKGRVIREPVPDDYYHASETMDIRSALEAAFMRKIREKELAPGARLVEGQLARQFGVSVQTIRELLIGLSRFGFVRKDHQRRWVLEGVTKSYALELHEIRVMFESRAVEKVCCLPDADPFWGGLLRLQQEHAAINPETDFSKIDFPGLDTKFHRFVNSHADNGVMTGFQDAIAMIFNYHYLWPIENQKEHDLAAMRDHLAIIDGILNRDKRAARQALQRHLGATRQRFIEAF
ncbi:MAG: GntR family transcriptional regulator [Pseudomonadota bacterium]